MEAALTPSRPEFHSSEHRPCLSNGREAEFAGESKASACGHWTPAASWARREGCARFSPDWQRGWLAGQGTHQHNTCLRAKWM